MKAWVKDFAARVLGDLVAIVIIVFLILREIYRRAKTCGIKTRYETLEAAQQKGQYVYRCPYCEKFHRTSWGTGRNVVVATPK